MERRVIQIDEEACNGCGLCETACHEGAIGMINGKARLLRDEYCDGLGDCLPACPQGAIHFYIREAEPFNEAAVKRHLAAERPPVRVRTHASRSNTAAKLSLEGSANTHANTISGESALRWWPVQLQLVPPSAECFDGADLLVAADCSAYANGRFHDDYMRGKVTVIGCPKLDTGDYTEKLTEILKNNDVRSVTVTRMEVPCCGGLEAAASNAIEASGKNLPLTVVVLTTEGEVKK